jgi:acetyltransferase
MASGVSFATAVDRTPIGPRKALREVRLEDGTPVVLRSVRTEDWPLLQELLESCSPTSLYRRFQHVTRRAREIASRFCSLDDERERVIVAEIELEGKSRLIGFAVMAMDANKRTAELAVLVEDRWQGKGLGSVLSDHLLQAARRWGLKDVAATTTPDNARVIEMARRRGFLIMYDFNQREVTLRRKFRQPRKTHCRSNVLARQSPTEDELKATS